ncbi:amidohydrolase [Cupriavidus malaysiensis]|uniref:amidohydrolase n=1 Tax=Cupriavidus malaysiensis TaxID=367825 RepID=UPI0009FDA3D4|nr:amidohydrolase [Cupriavidus malaysiensis]
MMCFACVNLSLVPLLNVDPDSEAELDGQPLQLSRRRAIAFGLSTVAGTLLGVPYRANAADQSQNDTITIFRNGKIYTVEQSQPWAEAVVVKGEHIVYVGDNQGATQFSGTTATVIDLEGRMMLPGFIESHSHLSTFGFAAGAWVNHEDPEEIYAAIREYAKSHPDQQLISGFGWMASNFPATGPKKEALDAIVADRPVLLISNDLHNYWANSKFLEMAGITKDTPRDVVPGQSWYEKDDRTGEPTGFISEVPALFSALGKLKREHGIDFLPTESVASAIEDWQLRLASAGITTVFDAGFVLWPDSQHIGYEIFQSIERRGKLRHRVIGSYYHNNPDVDPFPILRKHRQRYQSKLVQASVLKLLADGTELTRTAYYLQPYANQPDWRGEPIFPQATLDRLIREADAEGIDTHIHCTGDAAVRMSLDAIEAAQNTRTGKGSRHTICHAFLTDPADIPRFKKLGVVANTQIQWGVYDPYQLKVRDILGEERWHRMYSFKSFFKAGATVSLGTDALATGYKVVYKPLEVIQSGMTRQTVGREDGPFLPPATERLSLAELIHGYTINGAYQLRREHELGSIKAGKLADLIVLERNLFEVSTQEVSKVKIQLTMMNGGITHRDGV